MIKVMIWNLVGYKRKKMHKDVREKIV